MCRRYRVWLYPSMRDAYFFSTPFCDDPLTMKRKDLTRQRLQKKHFFYSWFMCQHLTIFITSIYVQPWAEPRRSQGSRQVTLDSNWDWEKLVQTLSRVVSGLCLRQFADLVQSWWPSLSVAQITKIWGSSRWLQVKWRMNNKKCIMNTATTVWRILHHYWQMHFISG